MGKKRRPCCRRIKAGLRPAPPHVFWPVTAQPLLIAAWLVGFMRTRKPTKEQAMKTDIYQRITDQIVSELEKGVRPWLKPWNAEHAAGRITRPLRGNGIPYQGINVLMLWSAAMEKGYAAPIWMTFKQARELKASVRKGENGSLVVYADKIIRTEADTVTGEEAERAVPFMKGYTVFNVEQIDGAPCRREKGVIRDDLGKPKLSYVHQSYRMPKGLWDHSMTGVRPKTAKSSQRRRVRAKFVWPRLNCLNPNPRDLSGDSRTPMTQVRIPSEACSVLRLCAHSVYSAQTPVRGLRMSWGPKRVVSPFLRNHGMAFSRTLSFASCMATESEYYPNARRNGRDRCGAIRIRMTEEAREREGHTIRGKSDSLVALTNRRWAN